MLFGLPRSVSRFAPRTRACLAVVAVLALPLGAHAASPSVPGVVASVPPKPEVTAPTQGPAQVRAQPPRKIGMANPASVHCLDVGGRLEIRTSPAGQYGICHLPDGRMCEEWSYFRTGECLATSLKNR